MLHQTFLFLGQLWQLFEVSQILEFLQYSLFTTIYLFQAEVRSLHTENEVLRSGDKGLSDIKERTTYVAEQLSSATKTAESSLK